MAIPRHITHALLPAKGNDIRSATYVLGMHVHLNVYTYQILNSCISRIKMPIEIVQKLFFRNNEESVSALVIFLESNWKIMASSQTSFILCNLALNCYTISLSRLEME